MSIPLERYVVDGCLQDEVARLFMRHSCVAHESDVRAPDDYFAFRLGGHPLTLRRFGSELRLLDNVCRHRFNLIDPLGYGNRQFRCAYHGWGYDKSGVAAFTPFHDACATPPQPLSLFGPSTYGGMVFSDPDGGNFSDDAKRALDTLGVPSSAPFHSADMLHECNWKLLVENVLEGYHLSSVHAETFVKAGLTTTSPAECTLHGNSSLMETFAHESPQAGRRTALLPGTRKSYRHLFVFPNLFVSVTDGIVYYVANVLPLAVDRSVLRFRLFFTEAADRLAEPVKAHIAEQAIRFTTAALLEDKVIVENCQIGIGGARGQYLLGAKEARIAAFHHAYASAL